MRIAGYFVGWLLALPGVLFAAALMALDRAIALNNVVAVMWEAPIAFAYGVPLAALVAVVLCILGFFRMGRVIGAGVLLLAALGSLAVMLESTPTPGDFGDALFLAPTMAGAALAGWLIHAETRRGATPPAIEAPR